MTRTARRPDLNRRVRSLRSPVVVSRRLRLVLPDPALAKALVPLIDDPRIARWTLHVPHPYRPAHARTFYRRWQRRRRIGRDLNLQAVRRSDGALVGGLGLHDIDATHLRAEVGYWIGRPFRRQGYAAEAVRALCRFAHRTLGICRIEAGVFPGNAASVRVLRSSGFRREGLMRQAVRKDGSPQDVLLFARLAGDRFPRAGRPRAGRAQRRAGSAPTK